MQSIFIPRLKNSILWISTISFTIGASVAGIPAWLEYSHEKQKTNALQQELMLVGAELEVAQQELSDLKPKLAQYLIREQARWHHAAQMERNWANTFGYDSTIQVKTPEQIAFPDRDSNQMIEELVQLSNVSEKPMDELIPQVINRNH